MFKANAREKGMLPQQPEMKKLTQGVVFEGSSVGKDSVRLFPMGGSGNVTKNMFVYEYLVDGAIRDIMIVDCGIGFPDPEMYGVDLVIPDVRYLEDKKHLVRGLVFSHGHEDHIGAISHLYTKIGNNIPMWGTKLTAAFANLKLKERKVTGRVTPVEFDQTLNIGPFKISFIRITHSIPDASHVVIETPIGIFYHGSDFKFDFEPLDGKVSELDKITAVGKKGVVCMLTDCLGSERRGFTASEKIIGEAIEKEMRLCPGKFFFTTQSSNVSRIQLCIDIAQKYGRKIIFLGRSVDQNTEEAVHLEYMKFPREIVADEKGVKKLPASKQCLIVAGSQGQPDSAIGRIASGNHRFVEIDEGDTVMISADPIPGNEQQVTNMIENLYHKGVRVSYPSIMEDLHVSGHGSQGDMMLLLATLGPKSIYPIGGTYRHMMQYRRLAQELGYDKKQVLIPEDGQILEFKPGLEPKVVETVELENVMIDGLGIGDVGPVVLRDRQTIAKEGIVVIVVPIDEKNGKVIGSPDIITRGFVFVKQSTELIAKAQQIVVQSLKLKKGRITDWQYVRKQIDDNVGSFLLKETGREPLIVPVIVEI